jgi:chemotaxis protein MotA
MAVIIGCIVVVGTVLAGFMMAGGHVGALIHPSEFVTIGGASFGALIIMSPGKVLKDLMACVIALIKGTPYNKKAYKELFAVLDAIAKVARRDGMLALEKIISGPEGDAFFHKYPSLEKNHHAKDFLCTGLSLIVDGKATASQLPSLFEEEIRVIEREHHDAVGVLSKTADALPGFGIVAAVLGIVVTMGAIDGPASEIGHKVGAALVGTFLGILMSYGFFGPMAARMELMGTGELVFFRSISAGIIAIHAGDNARDVIASARRVVATDCRPSLVEMAEIVKG